MKTFFKSVLVGVGMLSMTSALAGGPDKMPVMDNSGFYVGGNLGAAYATTAGALDSSVWGFGISGLLGYQFNNMVAVEAGAFYAPSLYQLFINGVLSNSIDFVDTYFAAKLIIPFSEKLSAFAKVGGAFYWGRGCATVSGTSMCRGASGNFAPYLSGGMGYYVTKNLELTAELGGIAPVNQTGLAWVGNFLGGVIYHFKT